MTELKTEQDLSAKIQKIADHMVFLEKKIDTLLERSHSQERKPFTGNSFRPGGGPSRGHFTPGRREGYGRAAPRRYTPSGQAHGQHGTRTSHYEGSGGPSNSGQHSARPPRSGGYQKKYPSHRNANH